MLPPPASLTAQLGKPLDQKAGQRINSFMVKGKGKAREFTRELGCSCLVKQMGNSVVGAGGANAGAVPFTDAQNCPLCDRCHIPQGAWELGGPFVPCPFPGTQRQLPAPA